MMKKQLILLILAIFCIGTQSHGQIGVIADKAYTLDTLRINSYSTGLSFLFYIADGEMDEHTTYRFANSAHFTYLFSKIDIELSLRQILEHQSDGAWYSNHFLMLSSGIFKYKPIDREKTDLQTLYVEPIFIYQRNSDRGLQRRFQLGSLFHPWGFIRPRFNFNLGIGIIYDWSSWEVNDQQEIDDSSPELKKKIQFINSRIKLRKDKFQDHSEWRPMLLLTLNYRLNDIITFNLNTSYQQSLVSPYSKEIRTEYPDLKKVYPYILTQLDFNIKLHKGFAMSFSSGVDYENNNLSLYKSSWSYNTLIGFSWTYSNQKSR